MGLLAPEVTSHSVAPIILRTRPLHRVLFEATIFRAEDLAKLEDVEGIVVEPLARYAGGRVKPYQFYAAEISYFSGKVRPVFRYKGLAYQEIAPTPQIYREVILPRTGLAFIPMVVTPEGDTLQDTSFILDELERRHPSPAIYPLTPVQRVVAYLVELYADEIGVLPAMHYRWSFPESEAKARADFAAANGDVARAGVFADRMKGSIRALGVSPASAPAIEAHLADLLDRLCAHFRAQPFLLGSRPSLADCALLGPFYAHLYLDAVPGRLLRKTAPEVCAWIEAMNAPEPGAGTFLADDALAQTLRPVLATMGRDGSQILIDALRAFEAWVDAQPGDPGELPRALGFHRTRLRDVTLERYTSSYTPWMIQRPRDAYAALAPDQRLAVDAALEGTGFEPLLREPQRHRVTKRGFKLVLER